MATSTAENYLKQILLLSEGCDGLVSMGALAGALAVVPGTATTMVKALATDGLVDHHLRHGVQLTPAGRRVALGVLRRHRLIETFLVEVLKMDWTEVHAEAELLEHAISEAVLDRLDALLGHPAADPHGDPIPTRQGKLDSQVYATLATCVVAKPLRIVRVTEQSDEFLQFAEQNGLRPGTRLRVTARNLAAGLITLKKSSGRTLALSLAAAGNILVCAGPLTAHRFGSQSPPPMMNSKFSALCRALVLAGLLPLGAHAGDVKEELDALISQVTTRIKAGQRTEAELAPDLAKFDALLAAHKDEKSDDVAKILVLKGTLYTQIIGDETKGLAALKQLKADFPASTFAKDPGFDAMIAELEAQQAYAVGKVCPDFAEKDLEGKPLAIANYKGKVVLLDFWATWCGPCVAELPNVVAAYQKFHARGFEIIGVSLDKADARQKLIDFTRSHEMPWVQYYDGQHWNNKLSTQFGIHSIPATFLLDGEGRILAKNLRGEELAEKLEALLPAK